MKGRGIPGRSLSVSCEEISGGDMAKTTTFSKVVNINFLREVDKKINLTTKGKIDKHETLEMLMIIHF